MDFNTLIDPMTPEEFTNEYKGKKFCIIKGNRYRKFMYSNIISWTKFSEYINNDRAVSGLQAILPNRSEERRVGKECRSRWAPYP